MVAPRVGAWIETWFLIVLLNFDSSHPVWVRGLKLFNACSISAMISSVAPRVGAWIETVRMIDCTPPIPSHPVWVRGLKRAVLIGLLSVWPSHPVWVRGLKQQHAARYDGLHNVAPRVGAWIETTELWTVCASIYEGRTPCGCVD